MKKALIKISIFILTIPIICFNLEPTENGAYYIDDANILHKDTKNYIDVYSNYLNENLNIDFYVVTTSSLNNLTIKQLSDQIYKKYNIRENGLLIVIAKENREIRVKTGSEMSKIITDEIIEKYLDKFFIPYLSIDNWNTGIKNGYSAFFKTICDAYEIDSSVIKVTEENKFLTQNRYYILAIIIWILTYLNKIYCNYIEYLKTTKQSKKSILHQDSFILFPTIMVNISLLILAYYISLPISLSLLCYQILVLYCNNTSRKGSNVRKKHNKRR